VSSDGRSQMMWPSTILSVISEGGRSSLPFGLRLDVARLQGDFDGARDRDRQLTMRTNSLL